MTLAGNLLQDNKYNYTWNEGRPISLANSNNDTFFYVTNYRGDVVSILDTSGR